MCWDLCQGKPVGHPVERESVYEGTSDLSPDGRLLATDEDDVCTLSFTDGAKHLLDSREFSDDDTFGVLKSLRFIDPGRLLLEGSTGFLTLK